MNTRLKRSSRRLTGVLLVLVALGVAACGSNASNSGTATKAATPPAQTTSSSAAGATTTSSSTSSGSSSNGIPQGPNAGDADSDNHGGPSDGDGNI
jgi:ABC-type glycerol-3-phosphate transport system substrate-binding protein